MSWRFWRKDKGPESFIKTVSMPTLARWYLYDTSTIDPNKLAHAIGLMPVSEEGEKTEKRASEARSKKVDPFNSFFHSIAEINATTITEAHRLANPDSDPEVLETMYSLIAMSSYLGIYSAFSSALELGIVINPGTISTTESEYL